MDRGQAHVLVSGYLLQEAIGLCEKEETCYVQSWYCRTINYTRWLTRVTSGTSDYYCRN